MASVVSVNIFRNTFPSLCDNFRMYVKRRELIRNVNTDRLNIERAVIGRLLLIVRLDAGIDK